MDDMRIGRCKHFGGFCFLQSILNRKYIWDQHLGIHDLWQRTTSTSGKNPMKVFERVACSFQVSYFSYLAKEKEKRLPSCMWFEAFLRWRLQGWSRECQSPWEPCLRAFTITDHVLWDEQWNGPLTSWLLAFPWQQHTMCLYNPVSCMFFFLFFYHLLLVYLSLSVIKRGYLPS